MTLSIGTGIILGNAVPGFSCTPRELRISRNTVRKYLHAPQERPNLSGSEISLGGAKLGPFKAYLQKRVAQTTPRRLPATVVLPWHREQASWFFQIVARVTKKAPPL